MPGDKYADITLKRQKEHAAHKPPSLEKSKQEFFNDDVSNHVFEHDQIHEVMAHRARPVFEYIASATDIVKSDKAKFFALSTTEQMQCALEEAYVIALERAIVPMLFEGKKLADSESALQWALMRICTTLTSGWFREFAVENYPAIWNLADKGYALPAFS